MHRRPAAPPPTGFDPIEALRRAAKNDADVAFRAASFAARSSREEEALPLLRVANERFASDARLWQMRGLAARATGDLREAVGALSRARDLAPADALIAHGVARARLEAGLPAVDDFLNARRLAPSDGSVLLGLAAARFAAGDMGAAIKEIESGVRTSPAWLDGHATLARLRHMAGEADDLRSFREATGRTPAVTQLWLSWLATLTLAERYDELDRVVTAASRHLGALPDLALYAAVAAIEQGDRLRGEALLDGLPPSLASAGRVWRVRALLRDGRPREAGEIAFAATREARGDTYWPYVALAWRLTGDARSEWLEGHESFVQVRDLGSSVGDMAALAERLRGLHLAREQPLDQSVRGGTQTDGPLLSRVDPEIIRLRDVLRDAVRSYVDGLPPRDARHPLLREPRRALRFAGSWSVRLTDGGHHADHVHSHGWISSAFYVALPSSMEDDPDRAGWLGLGVSSALLPGVASLREIEPKPGRLVLFPSTMWHGTRPFSSGERLTVAFDVARMG